MRLRPLGNRVLIKQHEVSDTTKGGIVLPTGTQLVNYFIGSVVAIPDDAAATLGLKPDDVVTYLKYGIDEVEVDAGKLHLVDVANLTGVYEQ